MKLGTLAVGQALYAFDVSSGKERVVLTAAALTGGATSRPAGGTAGGDGGGRAGFGRGQGRGGAGLPGISQFVASADGSTLLVNAAGRQFVVDRATLSAREVPEPASKASERLSANGKVLAFWRAGEVWWLDTGTMRESPLTSGSGGAITNGEVEFVSGEEFDRREGFWLASDGGHLAYQRTDTTGMEMLTVEDVTHQERPASVTPYPRPGKKNAKVQLLIVPVGSGSESQQPVECVWDHEKYPYIVNASWSEPGAPLTVTVANRVQTELVVLGFSALGGEGKVLARDTDPAWVNASTPMWAPPISGEVGGKTLLWQTERNGYLQLEKVDVETGASAILTSLRFGYRGLVGCNAKEAFVTAGGEGEAARVWRVPLTLGQGVPVAVTEARGTHSVVVARSGGEDETWVHAGSVDGKTTWEVATAERGRVGELASVTLPVVGTPNVEIGWVEAIDPALRGIKYHYAVVRPRAFDAKKKYPVIVSVYAGPTIEVVHVSPTAYLRDQAMADRGAIVVMLDGRGTPGRGRDWERAIKGNLIDIALTDQVAGLKALCAKYPEMDSSRVGIHGWSFGGYFSAMAAMRRPDVFKVAVAGAPVAAWEDYDTAYTERYLDLPDVNPTGYRASSVLTYCKDLRIPLLIIHGTADDNVYMMHSMKIVQELIRNGRDFDFLPMPGSHHGPGDAATAARVAAKTADFLFSHL